MAPSFFLLSVPSSCDHLGVDETLVGGVEAFDRGAEHVEHGFDGLEHALAAVARLVAVAQFVRFEGSGRCAGRNGGASNHAVFEQNLDLNGRVAPGIKNFASADCLDQSHGSTP